jgi:leader peptidase (prepilin peptidase) / N-methyltransferase
MHAQAVYDLLTGHPWGWLLIGGLGACLGSFLNVVIYRLPQGLSVAWPASHCPHCARRLAPLENIPILSYLLLGGRCRGCRARISWRYPAVEATGAGLTMLAFAYAGSVLGAAIWVAFVLALLAVLFIDLDHRIIPDTITIPGTVLGLLWALAGPLPFKDALLGVAAGGGGLLAVAYGYQLITGREGLGMGDVKLMAMVGAFLGWQGALGTILCGSFVGTLVGVGLMLRGQGNRRTALPFGTFLAPAAWVVLFAGNVLWETYLRLLPLS